MLDFVDEMTHRISRPKETLFGIEADSCDFVRIVCDWLKRRLQSIILAETWTAFSPLIALFSWHTATPNRQCNGQ